MEISILKNLEFKEWNERNYRDGMLNKFVSVHLDLGGKKHDITDLVIEAYGFNSPKRGKNKGKFIVNYSCYGFSLASIVKETIKNNEMPLVHLLIDFCKSRI